MVHARSHESKNIGRSAGTDTAKDDILLLAEHVNSFLSYCVRGLRRCPMKAECSIVEFAICIGVGVRPRDGEKRVIDLGKRLLALLLFLLAHRRVRELHDVPFVAV